MKRLIIVSLLMFGSSILIGQVNTGVANYKIKINGATPGGCCGCCGGLREVSLNMQLGPKVTLQHEMNDTAIEHSHWNFEYTFGKTNKVMSVYVNTKNGSNDGPWNNRTQDVNLSTCINTAFTGPFGRNQTKFQVIVHPEIELVENQLFFSDDTPFQINLVSQIESSEINWQYTTDLLDNTSWKDLPTPFINQTSLSIYGHEFLDDGDHGQTVYFRNDSGCSLSYDEITDTSFGAIPVEVDPYSNVIKALYLKPAPHILSAIPNNVKCYDSNNGEVKINFDRALLPGETLNILIEDLDDQIGTANGNPIYETVKRVENIENLAADNSFVFNEAIGKSLPTGNFRVTLSGSYNGESTYTDGPDHTTSFVINKPTPITFTANKQNDVWCNGGNDGQILISASGGGAGIYEYQVNNGDWKPFTNGNTHNLSGLPPASYGIKVRDTNGCVAREIAYDTNGDIVALGNEIEQELTIDQPANPVNVDFVFSSPPTAFGFSDGSIRAQITDGTPFPDGTYTYEWKNENGIVQTTIAEELIPGNNGWFLTLQNVPAGVYALTVYDANYNAAVDKGGCTVFEKTFMLEQPEPLQVILNTHREISCNQNNIYGDETDTTPLDGLRDESQDGAIMATVTGGVPFTSGQPYIYRWKKQLPNGSWQLLNGQTSEIAVQLSEGTYGFNVEDANGIVLGMYTGNVLIQEVDEVFDLIAPDPLQVTMESQPVSCGSGIDGAARAMVTGGIPPYNYSWSNGLSGNMDEITGLQTGNYLVFITDSNGCQVQGNITVDQPNGMEVVTATVTDPTCFQGDDGSIVLDLAGGTPPYIFSWDTGATSQNVSALSAGDYTLTVTDAQGCSLVAKYTLENPDELVVDLGGNRSLCSGQSHMLDATIDDINANYQWTSTNGFTSLDPQITVSEAGTYHVEVISSRGCTTTAEVTINTLDIPIDSEFLLTSQAYVGEEVVLINVSDPLGSTTQWNVPQDVEIIHQSEIGITLRFPEVGTYEIGLRSTQGDCYAEQKKNIVVEESSRLADPGDTQTPFIEAFRIAPNPNSGQFEVYVKLAEESPISLRIFDINGGTVLGQFQGHNAREYTAPFNLLIASATYFIVLETAKGTQVKRMIVQ
ncbi:T9SS type A sorting domain-containing protein [Spongiimicrobium sp. 3-5]|uniref:T9SS type A sorting domain-containing protein n=1 Tax=Spongiimicrobium sp. 3-5 TaxID=3332596 RepID=UPI0039810717